MRDNFRETLRVARDKGLRVAGFGAAAKAVTFVNFARVSREDLFAIADDTEAKQGKFLPGSRIPILGPQDVLTSGADALVIFPWNFEAEIRRRIRDVFPETVRAFTSRDAALGVVTFE